MIGRGSQVVCIADNWVIDPRVYGISAPVKGQVYTVRDILDGAIDILHAIEDVNVDRFVGIRVEEINNPPDLPRPGYGEVVFNIKCFRPVKKTSINIFTKELNKLPVKELV